MSRAATDVSPRPRKASTYGGSRAWSEEEESFLLESRSRKTPYKAIAQYLQKTELACRLHYHQLAYGTKRKRRGTSTSSVSTSIGSSNVSLASATRGHTPHKSIDSSSSRLSPHPPTIALPEMSPPTSPNPTQRPRLARSESPPNQQQLRVPSMYAVPATSNIPSSERFPSFQQLPKLDPSLGPPSDVQRRHSSCSLEPLHRDGNYSAGNTSKLLPYTAVQSGRIDYLFTNSKSTAVTPSFIGVTDPPYVDPARLDQCYKLHRQTFWSSIAREYGGSIGPAELEATFLRQHAASPVDSLPTPPSRSPVLVPAVATEDTDNARARELHPETQGPDDRGKASGGSCSIASILNEDQEVWSKRRQTV